ncbi:MAG: hypothetical protein ACFFCV_17690 [Promethearchaeota archaeon]
MTEEKIDHGLKKALIVFIIVFIIGILMLIVVIFTLTPYLENADAQIRTSYQISIVTSIITIIFGAVGIILYFIAPNVLKKYINKKW